MCGIAGILHFDSRPIDPQVLDAMRDRLSHRGPDGAGSHIDGPAGLAHRRLAILDLSEAGRQPMSDPNGEVWIAYNGEIYNHLELRSELESRGHRFRSETDTEVALAAYMEWGKACLKRFNGMFALGIWDGRSREFWIARDRIGIKPLFYVLRPNLFLFGSEIKALLAYPEFRSEIDRRALAYHLALNWMPAPYTLFKEVRQLLPGRHLTVRADGTSEETIWWELENPSEKNDRPKSEAEWVEAFDALMEEAVGIRLRADVPFGAFLSGGVDSSAISYWMSQRLESRLKTFSISFDEPTYDEAPHARLVAQRLGTDHHEFTVGADAPSLLPKLVWHSEEPTADSSMAPMYRLAEETRKRVTMTLCGDGADELLAGYETYQAYFAAKAGRTIPGPLRRSLLRPLVESIPASDAKVGLGLKLKRFVRGLEYEPEEAHATWRMIGDAAQRKALLGPIWGDNESRTDAIDLYRDAFAACPYPTPLERMLWVDTRLYLPNDMLVKVDRMSMAHGLEARVPFLDHRVVEFCFAAPSSLKLKGYRTKKVLLKRAMAGRLPDSILRRRKEGFNVPVGVWLKRELREWSRETLAPEKVRDTGLLDPNAVTALLDRHQRGEADGSHAIWGLLVLMIWLEKFSGNRTSP